MATFLLHTKRFPKTIILNCIYQMAEEEIQSLWYYTVYLDHAIVSKSFLQQVNLILDTLKFCWNINICFEGNWIFLVLMFCPFRHISVKYFHSEDLSV